jgi:hypothetical protein
MIMNRHRPFLGAVLAAAAVGAIATLAAAGVVGVVGVGPAGAAPGQADEENQFATVEIELVGAPPRNDFGLADARVTVETSRPISGTLLVVDDTPGQAATTYEFDVDLAANSVAVFPITFVNSWRGLDISASLSSNGQTVAVDQADSFAPGRADSGSVGLIGIDDPPKRVSELDGDEQLATLDLDAQLRGLNRMSSVVATPAGVLSLGPDQTLRLDAWLQGGGQLIIDGANRSLPDAYHQIPTANPARYAVGAGSVVYDDGWRSGIPVGGYLGSEALQMLADNQGLGRGAGAELALLANVGLPAVAVIAAILLLYSLIAGPGVFTVLGVRGQLRRIWIVLPALSLLFAIGILGFGLASRSGRSEAHITIVEVNERGSRATTNLLLTSRFGGSRDFETPDGWAYLGQGRSGAERPVKLRVGSASTEVSFDMPPGSSATAQLRGVATEFDGLVTIDDVRVDGQNVTALVTNRGDAALTDAIAFLGTAREEIGDIDAGEAVQIEVPFGDHSNRTMRELLIWPGGPGFGAFDEFGRRRPRNDDVTVAAATWTEWRIGQGTSASPDDVLGVVGWSDGYDSPIPGVEEGRTALFARTNVSTVGPEVGFRMVSRLADRERPIFVNDFSGYIEQYRLTFGPAGDPDRVALGVLEHSSAVELLTARGWSPIELPARGGGDFRVPPEAVVDGEVHIRSYVPEWIWGEGASVIPVLDAEDPDQAKLVDERRFRSVQGGPFFEDDEPFFEDNEPFFPDQARNMEEAFRLDIGPLQPGEEAVESGTTDDFTHHAYIVELQAGNTVLVTMSSRDDDSYLELLAPDGSLVASNDDYGPSLDSQIEYTPGVDGPYEVRAMNLNNQYIEYELTVRVLE